MFILREDLEFAVVEINYKTGLTPYISISGTDESIQADLQHIFEYILETKDILTKRTHEVLLKLNPKNQYQVKYKIDAAEEAEKEIQEKLDLLKDIE